MLKILVKSESTEVNVQTVTLQEVLMLHIDPASVPYTRFIQQYCIEQNLVVRSMQYPTYTFFIFLVIYMNYEI